MTENIKWHAFHPVSETFLSTAKKTFVAEVESSLAQEQLFDAFADSFNWHQWFPDVVEAGYKGEEPYGPGSIRYSLVGKYRYEQTMLEWDRPRRWSYRIDKSTMSLAHAQVELTEFISTETGTLVRWVVAADPKLSLRLFGPFMENSLKKILAQALANLEAAQLK